MGDDDELMERDLFLPTLNTPRQLGKNNETFLPQRFTAALSQEQQQQRDEEEYEENIQLMPRQSFEDEPSYEDFDSARRILLLNLEEEQPQEDRTNTTDDDVHDDDESMDMLALPYNSTFDNDWKHQNSGSTWTLSMDDDNDDDNNNNNRYTSAWQQPAI